MAVRASVVTLAGERGVRHSVEVTAETLYEAAATALSIFGQSEWADIIGPNTELHVAVKNPETMHIVTSRFAAGATALPCRRTKC